MTIDLQPLVSQSPSFGTFIDVIVKTSLLIGREAFPICHLLKILDHVHIKLRHKDGSRRKANVFLQYICYQQFVHLHSSHIMSMSNRSTTMFRRALLSSRLATPVECSARTIRPAFASYRQASSSTRLPTLTASETRRRPTVRPFQQPASQGGVNGLSPTSKRTIFIQTENTPNPDVSSSARSSSCSKGGTHLINLQ
jgi:hypothetical protein